MEKDLYREVWIKKAASSDILNENIDPSNLNIEDLWTALCYTSLPEYLLESFELMKHEEVDSEIKDNYRVVTKAGLSFLLKINYYFKGRGSADIVGKEMVCRGKNDKPGEEFYRSVELGDRALAIVSFEDEQGRTNATGEVGLSALEVFKSLYFAAAESFHKVGNDNIAVVMIRIDKKEEVRRLTLYTAMAKRFFPDAERFMDRTTEADEGYTILALKIT